MITYADVIRAVTARLRTLYDAEYKDVDITEGFQRPTLTVEADDVKASSIGDDLLDDTIPITVYYFAPDTKKGYADLIDKAQGIRWLFAVPFKINNDFLLFVDDDIDTTTNRGDKSLIVRMHFRVVQDRSEISVPGTALNVDLEPVGAFASDEYIEELIARIEMEEGVIPE